mgnify:CR=1 FL=1
MTEFLIVMTLQCVFFLTLQPMIKNLLGKGVGLILLICMTLGTFFRSLSTFLQVLMDPNEYDNCNLSSLLPCKRQSGSSLSCGWNHSCALFFSYIERGEF